MVKRPSLLTMLAGAAALAAVAQGAAIAAGAGAPETRLGASIQQSAVDRDRAASRRQRQLDLREQAAAATEARLQASAPPAQPGQPQMPAGPAATPGSAAGDQEDQFDELARIYQSMKPKNAAVVFEQLAMDVQMQVAKKMRERATAMIMANMTPNGAASLSMALARKHPVQRRSLPASATAGAAGR